MKRKKFYYLFLILLILLLNSKYIFFKLVDFLIIRDKPVKSDIIFVPGGSLIYRVPTAINLFKQNLSKKIVFSATAPSDALSAFDKEYNTNLNEALILEKVKQYHNIPDTQFIILKYSRSTFEDILNLKKYYSKNKFNSVIIVTDPIHTRRVKLTIDKIFKNKKINFIFCPNNKYLDYRQIFNERKDFYIFVLKEYIKLLFYIFY